MSPKVSTYQQLLALVRPYFLLCGALLLASLSSMLADGLGLGLILPLLDDTLIGTGRALCYVVSVTSAPDGDNRMTSSSHLLA